MKKLVGFSVVMLFVVLGLAATSHAAIPAGDALASLTGSVRIRNFIYPCANAFVMARGVAPVQSAGAFAAAETSFNGTNHTVNPHPAWPCIIANTSGVYQYVDLDIPALQPTTGLVLADWDLQMFGVTLEFGNPGVPFTFANPIPGGTPTEVVNIDVWPTGVH